jgi:predicted transcriptional regulator
MHAARSLTVAEIAETFDVSKSVIERAVRPA